MSILQTQNISNLNSLSADAGAALCWLGQAGFLIELAGLRFVIDAYLSNSLAIKYAGTKFPHNRMMPAPIEPSALSNIDLVLCTHAHTDHMDPGTLAGLLAANPKAKVLVPRAESSRAIERGVSANRLLLIDAGETIEIGRVKITAVPSAHEEIRCTKDGHLFLGYVLKGPQVTLWHSGDTVPWKGQAEWLMPFRIDLALLPINGRDELRANNGIPGNLNLNEAVALTDSIGANAMIAHHFGLFEFNTIHPDDANRALADLTYRAEVKLAELGVSWNIAPFKREALKILLVCKGNICRSPLAEGILSERLPNVKIQSAALMDWNVGRSPHPQTMAVAADRGVDLSNKRARQLTSTDFNNFDIILCMDNDNYLALKSLRPVNSRAQIGLLGAYILPGEIPDIQDPWGKGVDAFVHVHNQIEIACNRLASLITGEIH